MRLGGPIFDKAPNPASWVDAMRRAGYSAGWLPVETKTDAALVQDYVDAAAKADLVVAEVGAWSNPISPDDAARKQAVAYCSGQLALAERIGARCCVNIAGGRGEQWDGPHPDNLSAATFDLIVEAVRQIIDAVRPSRTFYTLETMPWVYPDSADSYLRLIRAVDRKAFAVHLDPVNMINCPERYFRTGDFIRDCVHKLGPHIRSCHAKDITLSGRLTVHLDECRPGMGALDYRAYLTALDTLGPDLPLMIEHLPNAEEYAAATRHIRKVADEAGVRIR